MSTNITVSNFTVLPSLGCLKLSGPDTIKFLQGQLTINAENITKHSFILGSVCNPKGRCISVYWATQLEQDVYLIMPENIVESTKEHLSKYAVFFKTELSNESQSLQILGQFIKNREIVFQILVKESNSTISTEKDESLWFSQLAEQKIPWINQTVQGEFLPHNLNLPKLNAVDFKKGCFTGQEVIARMQYKGKLKSHMQLLKSEEAISDTKTIESLNAKIPLFCDGKKSGDVICSSVIANGDVTLLALMNDRDLNGENFRLIDENGPILKLIKDVN